MLVNSTQAFLRFSLGSYSIVIHYLSYRWPLAATRKCHILVSQDIWAFWSCLYLYLLKLSSKELFLELLDCKESVFYII